MAERIVKLWYDKDTDILEVSWDEKGGYYAVTENEQVLADVDLEGNFLGFQIEGVTQLGDNLLKVRIPSPFKDEEPERSRPEEKTEKPQKSRP
jgi:uncharacterized protein YuzE